MDDAVWRCAPVPQGEVAAEVATTTGLVRGVARLVSSWYTAIDAPLDLPASCFALPGAAIHFDEASETLLCASGDASGSHVWACCLATRAFAHRALVRSRLVVGGACYAVDTRFVEVLVDTATRGCDVLKRWSADLITGGSVGCADDEMSWRDPLERGLALPDGERVSYVLNLCMILPEVDYHSQPYLFADQTLEAFAATVDDRGDIWMGVERMAERSPFLLWLSRNGRGSGRSTYDFSVRRRVRHEAVCHARRRDALLVIDGSRLSLIPFATLRALPVL